MQLFSEDKLLGNVARQGEIPPLGDVFQNTVRVAWPAMIESFMLSIVTMVDTIMVGALGTVAIAAVGLTTQPKFIAVSIFLSLNIAVSALVARRVGEGALDEVNRILRFSVLLTVLLTAVATVLLVVFAEPIILMMRGEPETLVPALEYFTTLMIGLGFTTIQLVINAAQRGAGNTQIAMRTNLVSNFVNIVFNYLLIEGNFGFPAYGVRGAAIATVIGSMFACAMSIASVSKSDGILYLFGERSFSIGKKNIDALVKIGSSSLWEQMFQRVGFLLYAMTVASLGTAAMAAHQIGMNICLLSFALGEGLSYAAVALVGRSMGEKRVDIAKISGEMCQRIGVVCSCAVSVVFMFGGQQLFGIFCRNDPAVMVFASPISMIICFVTFVQIAAVVYAGCLRGAGDTIFIAIVSLVSIGVIRPLGSWVLCYPLGLGLIGAWLGFALDVSIRWILTYARFKGGKWTQIQV